MYLSCNNNVQNVSMLEGQRSQCRASQEELVFVTGLVPSLLHCLPEYQPKARLVPVHDVAALHAIILCPGHI